MINKVLISACLLGREVRYNGSSLALHSQILDRWLSEDRLIPSCPELDGGMDIPRAPAEIKGREGIDVLEGQSCVVDINGADVTEYFVRGAKTALALCQAHNIKVAVLADGSPSCGSSSIYNGCFEGIKKAGAGVTAALLRQNGIQVFSQHSMKEADAALC
jgi:uncharacterized protein YbbK (DUF523 family)